MPNIFDYTNFRQYLLDEFAEKKAYNASFTYDFVARKAGFNNKGFAFNIIHGNKHLSAVHCAKISQALKLSKVESKYFKNLVEFNQTSELLKKRKAFEKICSMTPWGKDHTRAQLLTQDQYEYFSKWYHSAIRSLIGLVKFKNDYLWLSKKVYPPITPGKAEKSVKLLKRLGLVAPGPDGSLKLTSKSISSGPEAQTLGLRNFHFDCADLAKNAVRTLDRKNRNISGLTLGISKGTYNTICDEIALFQEKIMRLADSSVGADRVYQLNFHFFPLSKFERKRKRTS